MSKTSDTPVQNRYDIVYLFDIADGNPNGDPDAGNLPRIDPETNQGLVTDVCLKRKIRNFVGLTHGEKPPYEIYVKERAVLNKQHERAYDALKIKPEKNSLPKDAQKARELTAWMCQNFFDIRAFGAVMSTETNCGQVRGPIQFSFARSIDPIAHSEHAVTRCAVTTEREASDQDGGNRTMGRKFTIPYGLYRAHAFISAPLAEDTGFSESDLELFKSALNLMFEHDKSAARTNMKPCACIAFRHENKMGNARSDQLFERIEVKLKPQVEKDGRPPRSFNDYTVTIDEKNLPKGVMVERWI